MGAIKLKYFVLKPRAKDRHDVYATASQDAMKAYAESIRSHDPEFAKALNSWAQKEQNMQIKRSSTPGERHRAPQKPRKTMTNKKGGA